MIILKRECAHVWIFLGRLTANYAHQPTQPKSDLRGTTECDQNHISDIS